MTLQFTLTHVVIEVTLFNLNLMSVYVTDKHPVIYLHGFSIRSKMALLMLLYSMHS